MGENSFPTLYCPRPMKASEVLNRYANGERDFCRADLRGQSFKGQDLSGADFMEADIRGTNFTNAILKAANFTGAKAGVQGRWVAGQLMFIFALSILAGVLQGIFGCYLASYFPQFWNPKYDATYFATDLAVTIAFVTTIMAACIATVRQGFTLRAATTIGSTGSIAVAVAVIVAVVISGSIVVVGSVISSVIGVGAVAIAFAGSIISAISVASAVTVAGGIAGNITVAVIVAIDIVVIRAAAGTAVATAIGTIGISTIAIAITSAVAAAGASLLLGIYIALQAMRGNGKFSLIRNVSIVFVAIGGTAFRGANLTHANFSQAMLKSTHFTSDWRKDSKGKHQPHETLLDWVYWQDAKKLDHARLGKSMLSNPAVRDLLVTRNGSKKSYVDANLRSANLNGVNLESANLTWADLSGATLHHANLKNADLIETLALHTDFTKATLTGACLEAWNIDSHTKLEDVDCQYVYLLRDQQERRPSSGSFAPGEFTKLFQEALNTVDLIFRNGVDWKAFVDAFKTVQVDNDGTELTIQSIENKGDGVVVVRVSVPEEADKAKIHSEFNQNYDLAVKALEAKYHAELKAKDEQITIYRQQSADILEITRLMANRPVSIINENKLMNSSSDQSRNINVGGNLNATGSTFNLGEISGTITNAINQLPDDPDPKQTSLKELLTQLQRVIEAEADLPDADKADLLEQVQKLAEAKQTEEPAQKEGVARKAKKMFEATLKTLPDTAKIVEACGKLLPLILKALGLPG